jgi:hypothetical protein
MKLSETVKVLVVSFIVVPPMKGETSPFIGERR